MCRQNQTVYSCNCPPPLPTTTPCVDPHRCTDTFKHENRVFKVCNACTSTKRQNHLRSLITLQDERREEQGLRGEVPPNGPEKDVRQFKRNKADTQSLMANDAAVADKPKTRMLTVEEMLNPIDEEPGTKVVEDFPLQTKTLETLRALRNEEGTSKLRETRPIHRRTRGRGKRKSMQYSVLRMRL